MDSNKCHFCDDRLSQKHHYPVSALGVDVHERLVKACAQCVRLLHSIERDGADAEFNHRGLAKYAFAKNFGEIKLETMKKFVGGPHLCAECQKPGTPRNKMVFVGYEEQKPLNFCENCLVKYYDHVHGINFSGESTARFMHDRYLRRARRKHSAGRAVTESDVMARMAREELRRLEKPDPAPSVVEEKTPATVLTPREIQNLLNRDVIGQDSAKRKLAVTLSYYCTKIAGTPDSDVGVAKSNIIMIGQTGSGKTLLIKTLAKILDLPVVVADATTLTQASYRGNDVDGILSPLILDEDDKEFSEPGGKRLRGIVFVDEFDKMILGNSGEAHVQNEFLKLIEGTVATVPADGPSKLNNNKICYVNTSDLLFIFAGSFPKLDQIINKRLGNIQEIGFGGGKVSDSPPGEALLNVTNEDLYKFGVSPEILGRIATLSVLKPLEQQDYVDILTKPREAIIKQYAEKLKLWGGNLKYTRRGLELIAEEALTGKTGARAMFAHIEKLMEETLYALPDQAPGCVVTLDAAAVRKGQLKISYPKRKTKPVANKKNRLKRPIAVPTSVRGSHVQYN